MAREFAKQFYKSQAWRRARQAYIDYRTAIDGGICEMCQREPGNEVHHKVFLRPENIDDESITLNPDNFMLLCYDCHQLQHEAAKRTAQLLAKQRDGKGNVLIAGSYYYDENGEIRPFKVHLVWGPPGAGKTTYVREHIRPGDVVIDLDLIGAALSMADKADIPRNVERIAYDIRDFLYSRIAQRKLNAREVWAIAGVPKRKQRQDLAKKLDAELIFIPATFQECYDHVLSDKERKDKALQLAIIEKWFKDWETDLPHKIKIPTPQRTEGVEPENDAPK